MLRDRRYSNTHAVEQVIGLLARGHIDLCHCEMLKGVSLQSFLQVVIHQ